MNWLALPQFVRRGDSAAESKPPLSARQPLSLDFIASRFATAAVIRGYLAGRQFSGDI